MRLRRARAVSGSGGLEAVERRDGRHPWQHGNGPVVKVAAPKKITVSSGVEASKIIDEVQPSYPAIAKAARIQGTVVLAATIGKSGTIQDLKVVSGPAMLQQAALDAVRRWRYRPTVLDGVPVDVDTTISVVFTLNE